MHKGSDQPFYAAFGRIVGEQRRGVGLSQAALASRIGLTRASISNLEAGRQRPQFHQVVLIAGALDVAVEALIPAAVEIDEVDGDRRRIDAVIQRLNRSGRASA